MILFCFMWRRMDKFGVTSHFQQRVQMIKQNIVVYIFSRLLRRITTHCKCISSDFRFYVTDPNYRQEARDCLASCRWRTHL